VFSPGLVYHLRQLQPLNRHNRKHGARLNSQVHRVLFYNEEYHWFLAISSNMDVVRDFGLSKGCPSALAQMAFAETPRMRLTPNNTV